MKEITFYNNTPLDMRAIRTFGLSAKEGDNPIGFFGTGLKYAVAICAREGVPLRIYTEDKMYEFTKRAGVFRNQDYEAVYMNGEELPFTTELGKTWKLWAAFRELFCNSIDEDGGVTDGECHAPTRVVMYGPKAAQLYANRGEIYLDEPVEVYGREAEVVAKDGEHLYYRGIRVYTPAWPMLHTYNLTQACDLTEDRTLAFPYQAEAAVLRTIVESEDEAFIEKALTCGEKYYEHNLDPGHAILSRVSRQFLEVTRRLYKDYSGKLPEWARAIYLKKGQPEGMPTESIALTAVQQRMLERAKEVCRNLDHLVDQTPIIVTDTLGAGVLGLAKNRTVYLSREAFDLGTKMVAGTMMEEFIHLETGYPDFSRAIQNFLVNRIMTMWEESAGEPL